MLVKEITILRVLKLLLRSWAIRSSLDLSFLPLLIPLLPDRVIADATNGPAGYSARNLEQYTDGKKYTL